MAWINVIDLSTTWLIINALKAQMLDTYLYILSIKNVSEWGKWNGEHLYEKGTYNGCSA